MGATSLAPHLVAGHTLLLEFGRSLLADALERALVDEDIRKIDLWTARYHLAEVGFSANNVDPFFNANRFEDLAEAERLLPLER